MLATIMQAIRSQLCAMQMAVDWCAFSCGRLEVETSKTVRERFHAVSGRSGSRFETTEATGRPAGRPLRVSYPEGEQDGPYLFSMPAQYAILLMGGTTSLHWLLSQSLYVTKTFNYNSNDINFVGHNEVFIGYSVAAALVTFTVAAVFTSLYFLLGWQRLPGGESAMPLVGVCSLAISAACHPTANTLAIIAACHPPDNEPEKFWTKRIVWGATKYSDDGVERLRCAFVPAEGVPVEPVRADTVYS